MEFIVIDKTTGVEADIEHIALNEDWASRLIYCDMEGFAIEQEGSLLLLDECGNHAYCPEDRFDVVFGNCCQVIASPQVLTQRLIDLYNADPCKVAYICDEILDKSGGLLGRVRESASNKATAPDPSGG